MTPPSPKIWRARTEGEEYLIVMGLPAMVADASAPGLWAETRPAKPTSTPKNLVSVFINRYYTDCRPWVSWAIPGQEQPDSPAPPPRRCVASIAAGRI